MQTADGRGSIRFEATALSLQQGKNDGNDVAGDDLVAPGGGVDVVVLHHSRYAVDVLQQEGKHGDVVLGGEQRVCLVELVDVVRAVVRREGDAGKRDLDAGTLEGADDLVEVGTSVLDGQAA